MARTKVASMPEVGGEAPGFNLPSAQGGQLRLSMRTVRGPVVVVFYRGAWSEDDVEYFKALASKEDEINMAAASVVGISVSGPDEARDFVRQSGIKSYVLYDYARVASREWGTLQKDKEHGEYALPAVFVVGSDNEIIHAWTEDRPAADELLAKISEITGLPKPAEEGEEEEKPKKPKKAAKKDDAATEDKAEQPEKTAKPEGEEAPKESESGNQAEQASQEKETPEAKAGDETEGSSDESASGTEEEKKAGE